MPKYYRLNNRIIDVPEVRVIDDKGEQVGILPFGEALRLAQEKHLDLVEIAPLAQPPVCKIIDFKKFLYQQNKKERTGRSKGGEVKNVRLTYAIAAHDLKHNAQKAARFLSEGHKVNVEIRLRGREWSHQEVVQEKIRAFLAEIQTVHPTARIETGLKRMPHRGLVGSVVKQ